VLGFICMILVDMTAIHLLSQRCSYENGAFCKINIFGFGVWSLSLFVWVGDLQVLRVHFYTFLEIRNALLLTDIRSTWRSTKSAVGSFHHVLRRAIFAGRSIFHIQRLYETCYQFHYKGYTYHK